MRAFWPFDHVAFADWRSPHQHAIAAAVALAMLVLRRTARSGGSRAAQLPRTAPRAAAVCPGRGVVDTSYLSGG